jgi:hypothetical protein
MITILILAAIAVTLFLSIFFYLDWNLDAIRNELYRVQKLNESLILQDEESVIFAMTVHETLCDMHGRDFLDKFNKNNSFARSQLKIFKKEKAENQQKQKYYTAEEIVNSIGKEVDNE